MVPNELPIDAVGLWQIMAAGRGGFELSGTELVEFVRLVLLALFEKGAKPVTGATSPYTVPLTNSQFFYEVTVPN